MSKIKLSDINTTNYKAEDFKKILLESYDGVRFKFPSYDRKAYNALQRLIEAYNLKHEDNKTNLPEVVKLLTGLDYVTSSEEYHIKKLKANMDENGVISHIDADTRSFLKNKGRRLYRKEGNKEPFNISVMVAKLIPGAKYVQKIHIYSDEEIKQRLSELPVVDGEINFSGEGIFRMMLAGRAKKQGISLEELVKRYVDIKSVKENIIPPDQRIERHTENLRKCLDIQGNVVNLSRDYPSTHKFLINTARQQGCSVDVVINKLLDSPLMEYTYRGVKNKLSMYDINSPTYIGNNPECVERIVKAIRECMNSNNIVYGLSNYPKEYAMLDNICNYSCLDRQTVYQLFVPEAEYPERSKAILGYQTKEEVLNNLKYFDDGSGCIDSIRSNKYAIKNLKKFASIEGLHVSDFVAQNSDYYFSFCEYEVDYIDAVVYQLIKRYGYGGNVYRLCQDDKHLYGAVSRIKNFFPGGAKKSIEETLLALGFSYGGMVAKSKVTEEYVSNLLKSYYGEKGNVVDSLYDNEVVGYAVINFSGKIGMSVKDTLGYFGYEYYNQNLSQQKRLGRMKMTHKEYEEYKNSLSDGEPES